MSISNLFVPNFNQLHSRGLHLDYAPTASTNFTDISRVKFGKTEDGLKINLHRFEDDNNNSCFGIGMTDMNTVGGIAAIHLGGLDRTYSKFEIHGLDAAMTSFDRLFRIECDIGSVRGTSIFHTSESTSTSTGALLCYGGCAISKNLNVGGSINANSIITTGDIEEIAISFPLGGGVSTVNLTGFVKREGNIVYISIDELNETNAATATIYTSAGALVASYVPSTSVFNIIEVIDDGNNKYGTCEIRANGTIIFYVGDDNDFTGGTSGYRKQTIIYHV